MKLILKLFVACIVFSISANAQKMNASQVPQPVKAAFKKSYGTISVKWDKEDANYEAGFKQGVDMSVLYDASGGVQEIEKGISTASLPAAALSYVKAHYRGKKIKEAAELTSGAGVVTYEAEVGKEDLIFNSNGNYIKTVKE